MYKADALVKLASFTKQPLLLACSARFNVHIDTVDLSDAKPYIRMALTAL